MNSTNKVLAALLHLYKVVDAGDWSKGKGSANNAGYMAINIDEAHAAMAAVEGAMDELASEEVAA